MAMNFRNLDERTRALMLDEIEADVKAGSLFLSDNLNDKGRLEYPDLLRGAAGTGSDATLAGELQHRLNSHEKPRRLKDGGLSKPPVMRANAHEMLAQGEFNRFYIRAVCLRGLEEKRAVVVYRAKEVDNPRQESQAKIGQTVEPGAVLSDLRNSPGIDTALGLPPGPNSGLSVALV